MKIYLPFVSWTMLISVIIPQMPFLIGWLRGTSICCSGGGIPTKMYKKASNKVRKNCTEATGELEINRNKEISSIGKEISGIECLKIGLQFSIVALKPLSVAGKFVFDVEGLANLMLNKWFLSSKDAVTKRKPVPNLENERIIQYQKCMMVKYVFYAL